MKPTLTLIPIALLLASLAVLPAAEFPAGFSVGSDAFGPIVRVNVETIRDWSKVPGVKRFIPVPPAPGQTLPSHAVISNLKDVEIILEPSGVCPQRRAAPPDRSRSRPMAIRSRPSRKTDFPTNLQTQHQEVAKETTR